jgi:hypothetical protein
VARKQLPIGESEEARWWPGSVVYDTIQRRYGSIEAVEKDGTVRLTNNGLRWVNLKNRLVTLEGVRPEPSAVRGNPELAVVSLGLNPPKRGRRGSGGELPGPKEVQIGRSYIMRETIHGNQLFRGGQYISVVTDEAHARAVVDLLEGRIEPPPSAFRGLVNPPAAPEVFGSDVLAVVYQHEDDKPGDVRVHTFGGRHEAKWKETRSGHGVEIFDFPRTTGVYMVAEGTSRVVMQHRRGLPLVGEF